MRQEYVIYMRVLYKDIYAQDNLYQGLQHAEFKSHFPSQQFLQKLN